MSGDLMLWIAAVGPLRINYAAFAHYVAAQAADGPGIWILWQYTGAAGQLREALLITPHDKERCTEAFTDAIDGPREERMARGMVITLISTKTARPIGGNASIATCMLQRTKPRKTAPLRSRRGVRKPGATCGGIGAGQKRLRYQPYSRSIDRGQLCR